MSTVASSRIACPVASRWATTTRGSPPSVDLVRLLHPVLAGALTIDEAEQVGRERRAWSAPGLRVDSLRLGLQGQAEDAPVVDGSADLVRDLALEAVRRMTYLAPLVSLSRQRHGVGVVEAEDAGELRDRRAAVLRRQLVRCGDEAVALDRRRQDDRPGPVVDLATLGSASRSLASSARAASDASRSRSSDLPVGEPAP